MISPVIAFAAFPFFLQGIAIAIDEFYFHHKRDLPRWERLGHPLDTLSVTAGFLYLIFVPFSAVALIGFVALAAASCLLVTKDEWVHAKHCTPAEMWLHSVLFLLHPIVFAIGGAVWAVAAQPDLAERLGLDPANIEVMKTVIVVQCLVTIAFAAYQIGYWIIYKAPVLRAKTPINNDIYEQLGDRWYTAHDDPVALLRKESATKVPWVLEKIDRYSPRTSLRVLDVGCGAGFLSNALARSSPGGRSLEVHGLDISNDSLRVAKVHDSTSSVLYVNGDAYKLPFTNESFDVVTSMDFLEHVDDPEQVIREVSRVLKPHGLFFFHTFNRNWLAYFVIIKLVEWFVKNTPKHMHVLRLFIKPEELSAMCLNNKMKTRDLVGLRPRFSTITLRSLWTGIVPEGFAFTTTPSTRLSYLGVAIKEGPTP